MPPIVRTLSALAVLILPVAGAFSPVAPAAFAAAPAAASSPTLSLPANVEFVETRGQISKYRLKSNGMPIYLAENHAAPVVTFMVVYHVGSRNESPGNTGSAHLLEHMLFNKSTENFGKAKGKPTFQVVLHDAGADFGSTNMTTWNDRMNGYSTLPSDKMDLAMRIEADRLARGLILDEERQPEMSVVRNEYEIGENNPSNALGKALVGAAIVAHPYHWDTIGYRADIEGVSTETLRQHYRNFFWPDNAEAILVGDFDTIKALSTFDREFGPLPKSTKPIPKVITVEPPQEGERRVVVRRPGQVGLVQIGYIRPGALDRDFIPIDVLSVILGTGVNSRFYQTLVETGIASDASAANYTFRDPYPLIFEAVVSPDSTHQKAEDALKAAAYEVAKNGITDEELKRAQQQIEVSVVRSRDGTYNLTESLGEALASASWEWWDGYLDGLRAVSAADVQRVAATYLVPDHATVGWFVPATPQSPVGAAASGSSTGGAGRSANTAGGGSAATGAASAGAASKPETGSSARAGATRVAPPQKGTGESVPFAKRTLRRVLPNGVTLDVVENHAVPTVAIQGLVFAGRMTAPADKAALPQLTTMMLQRGTTTRDKRAIAALLDGAGARLDIDSTIYEANIAGSGLSRDAKLLLDVLAEELRSPAFPAEELTKAKAEMKSNVLRAAENTATRAFDRLTQLVFPTGHPYHAPTTEETLASLEKLTREDLVGFHKARYTGASLILAIVGDVDAEQIAGQVAKLFGGLPKGERPEYSVPATALKAPAREVVTMRGKANMNAVYGFASGLRRTDPDYEAALIANAAVGQDALSSRIGKRVRDTEGLSYNLASRFQMSDVLDGVWMVNVAVAPANLARALVSTREEFEKYVREGIREDEVESQKSYFAGNFQIRLGSNGGIAGALVTAEKFGYGPGYLDEFPKRVRAVTREQVNRVIQSRLHPDKLNLVVAGDLDTLPPEARVGGLVPGVSGPSASAERGARAESPVSGENEAGRAKIMTKTATFGAGCFWGVEEEFRKTKGVVETAVGYAGGTTDKPTYRDVCSDETGHAEVVQVKYDPQAIRYEELLDLFFKLHDPTQLNRQGPDVGTQYRSVVFFHDEEQRAAAEAAKARLDASGRYPRPIATQIQPAPVFWRAEEYHQKYFEKKGGGSCHI